MSVDIISLIDNNPISTFSEDYHSKLIDKIKCNFTNHEQQIFLSSFFCYLKYDAINDYVIDLDNVWNWLGFKQKVKAKTLLENNFVLNKDYKVVDEETNKQKHISHGGHNKETFMLNIETFKKLCLKSGTQKANEIHEYFIKLEQIIFETTKEECDILTQRVINLENENEEIKKQIHNERQLENERVLLDKFANIGIIIYIIKVKTFEDGTYIVKIGESRQGIQDRYNQHKLNYDECLLLDCFLVDKCKDFEYFIHHNPIIRRNKINNLQNHERENELFLIGRELTYQMILKIINDNIHNYNYKIRELLLEIELLKNKNSQDNGIDNELLRELIHTNKILVDSNKILTDKINFIERMIVNKNDTREVIEENQDEKKETKLVTGFNEQMPHLGPRLQKVNPESFQLVKVYECVTEAMNENKSIKRPSMTKAINENTIYCGFRWLSVERNLDPNIIHNIEPTREIQEQKIGYIAKLNSDKTEILNVYLDRKTASLLNDYKTASALDNPVKKQTIARGYYYILYDNCQDELIEKFEEKYGEPLLYKNGIGQYDENNILLKEFSCKYDCIRTLRMSDKTLAKALKNDIPYNGFHYREIGEKLCMV